MTQTPTQIRIVFPKKVRNFDSVIKQSLNSIDVLKKIDHIIFDMRTLIFLTPSALCPLTAYIHFIKRKFPNKKVTILAPRDFDLQNYLSRMNFFKLLDVDFREVNRCTKNQSFIELTHITKESARGIGFEKNFSDMLEDRLNCNHNFLSSLGFIVGELINNIIDHSESECGGFMCAQMYPAKDILEICFSDFGIGIPASLKNSLALENFDSNEDCEQIDYSLNFGVTSGSGTNKSNTGQGLYFLTKLIKENKGRMKIFSNNGMILINKNEHKFESLKSPWIGTTIMFELNLNNPISNSFLDLPKDANVDYYIDF